MLSTNIVIAVSHTSKAETHSAPTVTTLPSVNTLSVLCGLHFPVCSCRLSSSAWLDQRVVITGSQPPVIPRKGVSLAGGAEAQEAGVACGRTLSKSVTISEEGEPKGENRMGEIWKGGANV